VEGDEGVIGGETRDEGGDGRWSVERGVNGEDGDGELVDGEELGELHRWGRVPHANSREQNKPFASLLFFEFLDSQ